MENRKLYIADWHYGHRNVIAFDNRPFKSLEEMDASMIERWNKSVSRGDTVYILGDMFWCNDKEAVDVLKKLNGQKILVKGNHDRCHNKYFSEQFANIVDYLEIKDGDKNVVLCHYPIPCFKNHFYGWYHLYGHVHNSFEWNMMEHNKYLMKELYGKVCNMYNVGAMMPYMDYTPKTLEQIIEFFAKAEEEET